MATAFGEEKENLSHAMICILCNDKSRKPKLLACQHSLCIQCLAQHCVVDEGVPSQCPICRAVIKPGDGTIGGLPDNYLYDIVRDACGRGDSSEKKCVSCSQVEETTNASHKCLDCGDTLCQQCNEWHCRTTMTKYHVVVPIGDLKDGKFKDEFSARKVLYCLFHSTNEKKIPLSSYCKDCSCLVCVTCIQGNHQSHVICEPRTAKAQMQVQIQSNFKELQRSEKDQQKRLTAIETCITTTKEKWKEQETDIYDKATEIYTVIERIKEKKLAELKAHYEKEIQRLHDLSNKERFKLSSLQATVALTREFLDHSSDSDFLYHEKDVKTRMESSQKKLSSKYEKIDLETKQQKVEGLLQGLRNVFGSFKPKKTKIRHAYRIGKVTKRFSQKVEMNGIYGIAFKDVTKEFLLSGSSNVDSLLVLTENGQKKRDIPCEHGKNSDAIHIQGHDIFVTFYQKHMRQFVIFDANGEIRKRGRLPEGDQDKINTLSMAVAEDGTVYVASTGRIYKMNPNDSTLAAFVPRAWGQLLHISLHICLTPSDQLVVLSPPNILLYSRDGQCLSHHHGTLEETSLMNPCGAYCDEYGYIYISDATKCMIQVFHDMKLVGNIPIDEQTKDVNFIPLLLTPDRDLVYGYGNNLVKISFWEWGEAINH